MAMVSFSRNGNTSLGPGKEYFSCMSHLCVVFSRRIPPPSTINNLILTPLFPFRISEEHFWGNIRLPIIAG